MIAGIGRAWGLCDTGRMLRAEASVDLDAIRANVRRLRSSAPSAELMAVVKADGYGHGLLPSARAALDGGATWLGVSALEEALALRAGGVTARVLSWLNAPGEPLHDGVAADIDLSVSSLWALEETVAAARRVGQVARIHLKVDTGLGRSGATAAQWPDLVAAAAKAEASGEVSAVGVWSHFAYADDPGHPTIAAQVAVFGEALEVAERVGLCPRVRHLANSAATLTLPTAHFDLVRPGIAVYGLSPVPQVSTYGLRPAMTLRGRVALVKDVPAGTGVSYGHRYTTTRPTRLALIPLGYADGVPRAASNTAEIWLAGLRRRISGTVCMDQFAVDVGDDRVDAGERFVLFGPGDHGEPTAYDWADALHTISYEIVSRVGVRVPRTYAGVGG